MQFTNVTAEAKANVYFDGKVVSHGVALEDGTTKTFGVIFAGVYHFDTVAAERMEVIDGSCLVTLDGCDSSNEYSADSYFDVSARSGFTIEVKGDSCQYVCSYIS